MRHGGADGALRDAQRVLRVHEHVVPQPCLEVGLHLGQVEVRPAAGVEQPARAVEEVEPEVGQAARGPVAVDQDVLLGQVPAARPDHDGRGLLAEGVGLALGRGEVDAPLDRVAQVELAADHVLPQRRVRVLEVGQPDPRAGVQRVDGHLAVGGSGDLDPPVDQPGRVRGDPPRVVVPDLRGLGEEVEGTSGGDLPRSGCGAARAARGAGRRTRGAGRRGSPGPRG